MDTTSRVPFMDCVGTRQHRRAVWQFLAAFPLVLAAGAALRWGQRTNDASAMRRHRACQAPRTEAHSDTREVHTMALAHIPNGGDGERAVTMGATDDGAAPLTLVARDVPPARDPLGGLIPPAERPLLRDRVARVVIRLLLALLFRVRV